MSMISQHDDDQVDDVSGNANNAKVFQDEEQQVGQVQREAVRDQCKEHLHFGDCWIFADSCKREKIQTKNEIQLKLKQKKKKKKKQHRQLNRLLANILSTECKTTKQIVIFVSLFVVSIDERQIKANEKETYCSPIVAITFGQQFVHFDQNGNGIDTDLAFDRTNATK